MIKNILETIFIVLSLAAGIAGYVGLFILGLYSFWCTLEYFNNQESILVGIIIGVFPLVLISALTFIFGRLFFEWWLIKYRKSHL